MNPALTVKGRVTLLKAIREYPGVSPGKLALSDGRVAIAAASPSRNIRVDPIASLHGSATCKMKTDAVMHLTRGEDWNAP